MLKFPLCVGVIRERKILRNSKGNEIRSFTIITTQANDLLWPIHDRMPVILRQEDEEEWLDPDITDSSKLTALLVPFQSAAMEAYPVSILINTPKNDRPECITAVRT